VSWETEEKGEHGRGGEVKCRRCYRGKGGEKGRALRVRSGKKFFRRLGCAGEKEKNEKAGNRGARETKKRRAPNRVALKVKKGQKKGKV